jgi:hypothetical protein
MTHEDRLSTRIGLSAVDIWGLENWKGLDGLSCSPMAKVDPIPVDDQSLLIRQIVETGRIAVPDSRSS